MSGQCSGQNISRDDVKVFLIEVGLLQKPDFELSGGRLRPGDALAAYPQFYEDFAEYLPDTLSKASDPMLQRLWHEIREYWRKPSSYQPDQIPASRMLENSIRMHMGLSPKHCPVAPGVATAFLTQFALLTAKESGGEDALVDGVLALVQQMWQRRAGPPHASTARSVSPPANKVPAPARKEGQKGPATTGPGALRSPPSPAGRQAPGPETSPAKSPVSPRPAPTREGDQARMRAQPATPSVGNAGAPPVAKEPAQGPPSAGPAVLPAPVASTPAVSAPAATVLPASTPPAAPPPSPGPIWKYLPVPDGPDKHTEFDARSGESPEGMLILGARARGKKHKHEGTNCDDWFEFAVAGKWSIFAVADGGGSYKFSRVGAQAACQGGASFLAKELEKITIKPRQELTQDIMNDEGVMAAKAVVHEAMRKGWESIQRALAERENDKRHYIALQHRDLTLRDMYSTLLLAVHTTIQTDDGERSLVFSCAGGDGMIAVINKDGDCNLLMKPDSGEFSGEVEFLGPKMLSEEALASRTFPFAGGAKALMLMTDGVADDYFPNSPRMAELYADLVLNEIIPLGSVSDEKIASDLKAVKLPDMEAVRGIDLAVESERLLEKPEKIRLASAKKYAEAIGIEADTLARRPGVLAAALRTREGSSPPVTEVEQRLLVWLDSYHVRGSFDDRTLIVMALRG